MISQYQNSFIFFLSFSNSSLFATSFSYPLLFILCYPAFSLFKVNLQLLAVTPAILSIFLVQGLSRTLVTVVKNSSRGRFVESTGTVQYHSSSFHTCSHCYSYCCSCYCFLDFLSQIFMFYFS